MISSYFTRVERTLRAAKFCLSAMVPIVASACAGNIAPQPQLPAEFSVGRQSQVSGPVKPTRAFSFERQAIARFAMSDGGEAKSGLGFSMAVSLGAEVLPGTEIVANVRLHSFNLTSDVPNPNQESLAKLAAFKPSFFVTWGADCQNPKISNLQLNGPVPSGTSASEIEASLSRQSFDLFTCFPNGTTVGNQVTVPSASLLKGALPEDLLSAVQGNSRVRVAALGTFMERPAIGITISGNLMISFDRKDLLSGVISGTVVFDQTSGLLLNSDLFISASGEELGRRLVLEFRNSTRTTTFKEF